MSQDMTMDDGESDEGAEEARMVDPEAFPTLGVLEKYFGIAIGSSSKDAGGFYSTLRVLHPTR